MFSLPDLLYDYNSLEPYIDAQTMRLHHDKHHAGYVAKLNATLEKYTDLTSKSLDDLLQSLDSLPQDIRAAVRNNGGGHANHSLFWPLLTPKFQPPSQKFLESLNQHFGSLDKFKEQFGQAALAVFGSGWTWLVSDNQGKLQIISTSNQDSPVSQGLRPLLGLDVWEHAYYLKYQNRRPEYVDAFWRVVNWQQVEKNLE